MLTHIVVDSPRTDLADLTLLLGGNIATDPFQIRDIQGLGPVKADVNTQAMATDGESPTGSRVGKRNIVLSVGLNPDWNTTSFASLRETLYEYFMPKLPVTLRFYRDDGVTVQIAGTVEACEPVIFTKDPEMQVSILCPDPYFVAVSSTVVTGTVRDVDDPVIWVDHDYVGNAPTGFVFKVQSSAANAAYNGLLNFLNRTLGDQYFGVNVNIDTTEYLEVSTVRGNKYAREVNVANPTIYANRLADMIATSVWTELRPGLNKLYAYVGSDPGQDWSLTYYAKFGGL